MDKRRKIAKELDELASNCDYVALLIQPIARSIETGMAPDGKPTTSSDEIAALQVAAQMLELDGKLKEAIELVSIIKKIGNLGDNPLVKDG